MRIAFVFPGQGSQEVGMGRSLSERSTEARRVFARADRALSEDSASVSSLCFDGPAESLTLTENAQPAILTVSVAAWAALRERIPNLVPALVAGHSLGEYSALVAAGALEFEQTVQLVRLRGLAMQQAVPPGVGAMAAVMGLETDTVVQACADVQDAMPGRVVTPANFNAPGQVVVAGHADAVTRLSEEVSARRGRAIPLKVSAPFHCALMQPAADRVREALERVTVQDPSVPVVANVDAVANAEGGRVRSLLERQVAGSVRWEQSVRTMIADGVDTFIELGPGRVLAGLIKRIHKGAITHNVFDATSLDATCAALEGR
jgi:[acyl-carrier-protein] S-malonyltransferase